MDAAAMAGKGAAPSPCYGSTTWDEEATQEPLPAAAGVLLAKGPRRRLNPLPILACLLVPWLEFLGVSAALTFKVRGAGALVAALGLGALALGLPARRSWQRRREGRGLAAWCLSAFLLAMTTLAWVAGLILGLLNSKSLKPYEDMLNLALYVDVEPGESTGQQLMDAGRILFKPGSRLDLGLSSGFKSGDVYCAAPVAPAVDAPGLESYDFWAVGVNCCSGTGADFHCGEYDNPRAAAAMRLMDDSQRPYFRLAVQQAEAAYHIRARHPIFLHWMQDPVAEVERYPAAAHRRFTVCLWSSLALQLFLTAGLAAVVATHSGAP